MNITPKGAALIQSFEKCRLEAYLPTPDDKWTVGWGHCGPDIGPGVVWTQEEADAVFLRDIEKFEACVERSVTVPLTPHEFDACVSLCFNIGCGAFSGSTLVKLLNASDYDAAQKQFSRWNKQAGKELAGLTRRRAAEAELFEEVA